jgi:hypothetical protein
VLKKELEEKFVKTKWIDAVKATLIAFILSIPIQSQDMRPEKSHAAHSE